MTRTYDVGILYNEISKDGETKGKLTVGDFGPAGIMNWRRRRAREFLEELHEVVESAGVWALVFSSTDETEKYEGSRTGEETGEESGISGNKLVVRGEERGEVRGEAGSGGVSKRGDRGSGEYALRLMLR